MQKQNYGSSLISETAYAFIFMVAFAFHRCEWALNLATGYRLHDYKFTVGQEPSTFLVYNYNRKKAGDLIKQNKQPKFAAHRHLLMDVMYTMKIGFQFCIILVESSQH